jgi:acyl dehydratase
MTLTIDIDDLPANVGAELGWSEWREVTQQDVDRFAEATGDHQWIHVDPERAAQGPFGGTIAHGYLTLSLVPVVLRDLWRVNGVRMGVNYGADRIRFPAPVHVGKRLRAGGRLAEVKEVPGGFQCKLEVTFEVEGSEKPACVAEILVRHLR